MRRAGLRKGSRQTPCLLTFTCLAARGPSCPERPLRAVCAGSARLTQAPAGCGRGAGAVKPPKFRLSVMGLATGGSGGGWGRDLDAGPPLVSAPCLPSSHISQPGVPTPIWALGTQAGPAWPVCCPRGEGARSGPPAPTGGLRL